MSSAPQSLKDARAYLMLVTGKPVANFGIRGVVGPKRNSGYHLGRADIYGPGGLADRDYSNRRPRDRRGLSNSASALDVKLSIKALQAMRRTLIKEALAGRAPDLAELIGPGDDGRAYDWRKPHWAPIGPRPRGDGHEWHIHLSFLRDSEHRSKVPLLAAHFGPAPSEPEPPDEPADEPEPEGPALSELELLLERITDLQDANREAAHILAASVAVLKP